MSARAVIGANFGDEGKGLMTDYLCASEGAGVVIRFNGGAQAGHTVVTPGGTRHVFSHFGSGTLLGVPTFLSRFFVCNPLLFMDELERLPGSFHLLADPNCLVTTFVDMLVNQNAEDGRGARRHGSCGVGFNQTIVRDACFPLRMRDLWDHPQRTADTVARIAEYYFPGVESSEAIEDFCSACQVMAASIAPAAISTLRDPVFEGAQGLLLDQSNREFFPHVTRSNTGIRNVLQLCDEGGFGTVHAYYVTRSYLTRHGAGPLPGEDDSLYFEDETNLEHPYQGKLRFAPLVHESLLRRIQEDFRGEKSLVVTHCDQFEPLATADLYSYGPTRDSVERAQAAA